MPCTTSILWRCHDGVQRIASVVEVLDLFPRSIYKGELPAPLLATLIDLADRVLADPSANPDASSKLAGQLSQQGFVRINRVFSR